MRLDPAAYASILEKSLRERHHATMIELENVTSTCARTRWRRAARSVASTAALTFSTPEFGAPERFEPGPDSPH